VTQNGRFPLPDAHEEALEYVYLATTQEIKYLKELEELAVSKLNRTNLSNTNDINL
jgi:hypothetical protein